MGKKTASPNSQAEDNAVADYLRKVNRPYSATDVFNNLHGKYPKNSIVKALDRLIGQDAVVSKTYGKMAIYSIKQSKENTTSAEQLEAMNAETENLTKELESIMRENQQLSSTLREVTSTPVTDDARELTAKINKENEAYHERLDKIKQGQPTVSPDARKQIETEFGRMRKEWRTRRKMFRDIFHAVTEHTPGKPQELKDELGIEEDPIPYEHDPLQPSISHCT